MNSDLTACQSDIRSLSEGAYNPPDISKFPPTAYRFCNLRRGLT